LHLFQGAGGRGRDAEDDDRCYWDCETGVNKTKTCRWTNGLHFEIIPSFVSPVFA
jgi:hypothetical protein